MMTDFESVYQEMRHELLRSQPVDVGTWHSQSTKKNPLLVTMEVPWVSFDFEVPSSMESLIEDIRPNIPWAEEHFQERVGGVPINPPPSHIRWPWSHSQHQGVDEEFSHTYPERMWPTFANEGHRAPNGRQIYVPHMGIRFEYGSLEDVATLLAQELYTRQAWLPIFFPEDTGGSVRIHERIPCSLGYHFMVRNNEQGHPTMDCMYPMRSCDFVRHFRDDIYMAARLLQWMVVEVSNIRDRGWDVSPGYLRVHISSLHAMEGDRYKLRREEESDGEWQERRTSIYHSK